jgi:hypothetical protein
MSNRSWLLWTISLSLLVLVLLYELLVKKSASRSVAFKSIGTTIVLLLVIALSIFLVATYHPHELKAAADRGPVSWVMVLLLYLAMVLGMIAQSFFFQKPGDPTGPGSMIKPILASPIVFIPLVSSYQSNLTWPAPPTLPDLMIMLVAFQNGFFWKVVFDKQAEVLKEAPAKS